ncbi:hypothetical protein CLAFUW4_13987 [Fulvia fulva]|uniref:Uncharacterized protein n=1 Tax=Passalora fulva TaxID=5499 RepID=A0A9Q8PL51_PASFU|nr:uncharacterized protein CLAFUR5_13825 [Fulvia fulva]KAK4610748.1 hypothetical protein CLAFUR4_13990 [Fulvia fulva]KAK4610870.1 hypothetical protein CLAFUR0_13994 [Fulvia fulva]UJO24493.1 hypothetical protein CLAFUR5_13825 [Fulvia fulva]WPV21835.1 hypothetical protein CLAFUW4_13987 [Fulvia fulva]WPV37026.1 hypothetical protein CLAFUW7_13995 [Fulvia fulva]
MGNRQSTPTTKTTDQEPATAVNPTAEMQAQNEAETSSHSPFLGLPPEVRVMIYEHVLSEFEITTAAPRDRDLAVPLLNVSRFVAEEAMETDKKRILASKQQAAKELKTAVDEMCTKINTYRLPELDVRRHNIAICEEELTMIAAVKREYRMP